ncbi:MbtH family protein [Lentzea sp. JNUCC 0626]|uniref:MbtH family protein n=1 Tax=Lentzea sp. JNUCC 0626 TaxID=3367513 RepID=UPI003747E2F9
MSAALESEVTLFRVLVNAENQHSLWPESAAVPAGWKPVFGPVAHAECIDYVNANWLDMRPASMTG